MKEGERKRIQERKKDLERQRGNEWTLTGTIFCKPRRG